MPDDGILATAEVIPEDGAENTETTETTETQPVDSVVRPEYLDEQFWNKEKGEANVEGLSKSYKDLRAEFNKRNDDKVGETIEEYGTEEFYAQEGMEGMQEDGVMQMALTAAKDAGMGVKQAQGFIQNIMNGMAEFAPVPVDVQAEMESLGKNGPHMVSGLKTWVDGMKNHGDINDEVHSEILKLGATAAGIKALDVLRQKSGVMNIPTGTAVSGTTHMGAEDWYTATYETHAEGNETRASYDVRMKALGTSIFGSGHGTFNGASLGNGGR